MLENYAASAQRVVSMATVEAQRLGHSQIGTEHLLLGLLSDDAGEAADPLRSAGVTLAAARHKVVEASRADGGTPDGETLPFTPRASRALERAGRFSRKDQSPEVHAGHVLLGVLDVEGLACQVLRGLDVDIAQLRDALVPTPVETPVRTLDDEPPVEAVRPLCPNCRQPLDDTLAEVLIQARRADAPARTVAVVYCTACGTSLGVVRPES